jgi:hypothetical protein
MIIIKAIIAGLTLCFAFSGISAAADVYGDGTEDTAITIADRCDDPAILKRIESRFDWAEQRTWHRGFEIDEIVAPRLRYQVLNGPSIILHDHCIGDAVMTDGSVRTLVYAVSRGMGFASMGDGVSFCVQGLDPWRVFGADCSTVK